MTKIGFCGFRLFGSVFGFTLGLVWFYYDHHFEGERAMGLQKVCCFALLGHIFKPWKQPFCFQVDKAAAYIYTCTRWEPHANAMSRPN